jgi:hypothetical protein
LCISAFFQIRASRGSRAFHCLQSRYTGRKRRGGGRSRSSAPLSSEEEGRSKVAFVTGKLRLSGLEGTSAEEIAVSGLLGDTLIEVVRADGGVRETVGFELDDKSVFLLFIGVSGRGFCMVVVSKAACT